MRLCHRFVKLVAVCFLIFGTGMSLGASATQSDAGLTKYEIKKFRFGGHRRKKYERLVVEFIQKETGKTKPTLKVEPNTNGKEATIYVDQALLVGAIPEALINDSYVTKSKYLGPVSINTDGGGAGFSIRTFLKEAVTLEAFLLEHPSRLVLDVFPMNAPEPDPRDDRDLASESAPAKPKEMNHLGNRIVCYPASQQVIATVDFHPKTGETKTVQMDVAKLSKLEDQLSFSTGKKVETAICFPASSQLSPDISFQPRLQEATSYVQQDPMFVGSKMGAPQAFQQSLFGGGTPQAMSLSPVRSLGSSSGMPSMTLQPPATPGGLKPRNQVMGGSSLMPPLK